MGLHMCFAWSPLRLPVPHSVSLQETTFGRLFCSTPTGLPVFDGVGWSFDLDFRALVRRDLKQQRVED